MSFRWRTCSDPAPRNAGKICSGPGLQEELCNGSQCKGSDCPRYSLTDCRTHCDKEGKIPARNVTNIYGCPICSCTCAKYDEPRCVAECSSNGLEAVVPIKDPNNCDMCTCCPKVDETRCARDCKKTGRVPKYSILSGCQSCECTCPDYDAKTCNASCSLQGGITIEGAKDSFGCQVCRCCLNDTRNRCQSNSQSILTKSEEAGLEIGFAILACVCVLALIAFIKVRIAWVRLQIQRQHPLAVEQVNGERPVAMHFRPLQSRHYWLIISNSMDGQQPGSPMELLLNPNQIESTVLPPADLEEVPLTCSSDGDLDGNRSSLSDGEQCCIICMECPIEIRCIPCGHTNMCKKCLLKIPKSREHGNPRCPICRTIITKYQKCVSNEAAPVHHFKSPM